MIRFNVLKQFDASTINNLPFLKLPFFVSSDFP